MALIQQRQIAEKIDTAYSPHINVSDLSARSTDEIEVARRSRGLAAYALAYLAGVDPATGGASITDGFKDNGVDAVYFDNKEKILYTIQTKWNTKHTGSIDLGDCLKFIKGTKDLLSSRYSKFNDRFSRRQKEIDAAINSASKVVAVICYSGSGSFSPDCRDAMESFLDEVDETRELVSYQIINQPQLHEMLMQGAAGSAIAASVTLFEWRQVQDPLRAYYGQIAASDLIDLHRKFGHRLFSRNIRMFLGDSTQVNAGIFTTVSESPEFFWYYNNGITALASSIRRTAAGGATRASSTFECIGLTVVNGAQTIGSLSVAAPTASAGATLARVPVRIISLEGAPDGFAALVTRNNNTQNRIDSRNFVALDPEQDRLKGQFVIDKIDYEYRQGEIEEAGNNKLGLVEATIALACSQDGVDLAVLAKREIGKLWEDISRPPYKLLFNSSRTSEDIWMRVTAFRRITNQISVAELARGGKSSAIITHGNRLISHVIYPHIVTTPGQEIFNSITDRDLAGVVSKAIDIVVTEIDENFADNYVASLFKNLSKCRILATQVLRHLVAEPKASTSRRRPGKPGNIKTKRVGRKQKA